MTKFSVIEGDKGVANREEPKLKPRSALMKWLGKSRRGIVLMLIAPADLGGVNRLYGLDTGDALIRDVRRRTVRHAPKGAVITRFAGGKAAVAIACRSSSDAATLAKQFRMDLAGDGDDLTGRDLPRSDGGGQFEHLAILEFDARRDSDGLRSQWKVARVASCAVVVEVALAPPVERERQRAVCFLGDGVGAKHASATVASTKRERVGGDVAHPSRFHRLAYIEVDDADRTLLA